MSQIKLDSSAFTSQEEEKKFLTLSEIFKNLEPTKIIAKLKESNGEVELAIEKLLEEQPTTKSSKTTPNPTSISQQRKTQKKERTKEKPKETPKNVENDVEKVIKLQKNLEQIYEKSFEVLEKKINEQSEEIEMLRDMVKTRDNEIQRLKKELEDNETKTNNLKNGSSAQFYCRCHEILSQNVMFVKHNIDKTLGNAFQSSPSQDNSKGRSGHYQEAVREFNFRFRAELAFTFLYDLVNNAISREELDSLLATKALWEAHTLNKLSSMLNQTSNQTSCDSSSHSESTEASKKKNESNEKAPGVSSSPSESNTSVTKESPTSNVESSRVVSSSTTSPLPPPPLFASLVTPLLHYPTK